MSERDVSLDEMRRLSGLSDRDIERLFVGQAPDRDAELSDVARFFEDLSEAYPEASTEVCEEAHVAAMIETAQLLAENGDPVVRPASKAHGPENQASGLPKWRRNVMLQRMLASYKAKIAAAAMVLVMAFGGTAFAGAAGVLPAPVQDAVSNAAGAVGIDLPSSDQANVQEGDVNDADNADQGNVQEGDVNDADNADQGNVQEGDVNSTNDGGAANTNEGDVNNTNDGDVNNTNDGGEANTDNGDVNNTNDGGEANTDNGAVDNTDNGNAGQSGGGSGDSGGGNGQN